MSTELVKAQFRTIYYSVEAFGANKDQAYQLLKEAWAVHAQNTDAEPGYMAQYEEEIAYSVLEPGMVRREDEIFMQDGKATLFCRETSLDWDHDRLTGIREDQDVSSKLVRARFETENFVFEAFGETKKQAQQLLVDSWQKHSEFTGADPTLLEERKGNVEYAILEPGLAFKGNECLVNQSAANKPAVTAPGSSGGPKGRRLQR